MLTRGSSSFAQHSTRKRGRAYSIAAVGLEFGSNVAEASDILAPLKAACRATKTILDVIQAIDDNKEKWTELVQRLEEHKAHIKDQIDQFEKYPPAARVLDKSLSQSLNHYKEILEDFKNKIEHHRHKRNRKSGIFSGITRSKLDADAILQFYRDIEDRHKRFMEALTVFTARHVSAILEKVDASTILQLPMVAFVASSVHTKCLEGTRQAVLRMIHDWAEDMGGKPIFWLCDIAGSGKSTVAMSVVASWATEGTLGGQFFFSMTCNDATTTEKFCSTIARELAQHMPELRPYIADALKQKSAILRSSFGDQFRALITNPLRHRDERVILVIDAIDECSSGAHTKELLDTLAKAVQESKNLKIFITSRPDPVIEGVLGPLSIKQTLEDRLHDVKHSDNIRDIATYVNKSLHGVLSQDQRQKLVDKANGLFIWASTACQMLRDKSSFDTPQVIYQRLISADHAGDIDDVYNLVFERVHPRNHAKMWKMLAILLAAYEPLRTDELDELFGVHGSSAKMLVRNIASILVEDTATKTIQFRHPTMVEYLQRCSTTQTEHRDRVSLHISDAHGQLAAWCFRSLRSPAHGLKFNICKIASSFDLNRQIPDLKTRVSKFIQARLRYASSHWSFHLAQTDGIWRKNLENDLRHTISSPNVLYWIEILSITERVPRAIAGLRAVTRQKGFDEETMNRIIDANRFMMAFSAPIQDSAPHIYVSALAFAPMKSPLRLDASKEHRNILKVTQGLEEKYHDLPQALRGHTSSVRGVAFSPDGSRIISGSSDSTIRVWDAETGQTLGEPLRGHNKSSVNAVAFSPDGSRFVSGSWDNTLRLWDAETAKPLGEPLEGHEDSVNAVAFSPDASRIASASWDKAIRLWDANTGQPLGEPLRGHKGWVNAVAFSEDGSRIVSGSSDQTIQLWDVETGQPLGLPLTGHNSPVNTVVFSPDGSRIVSGALDGTIRLWDGKDVQPLGELLRGHTSSVNAIAFSPDGSTFITGSWDRTIRLWNAATGQPVGEPLTGHTHWVNALAFSPDGSRIISGSSDKTIRIWDAKTGLPLGEPHPGHASAVNAVSFSPDGLVIASSSSDNTVRLWAADTGQPLTEPLRGHTEEVNAVTFSPDGFMLASASSDRMIRLWDTKNGRQCGHPLRGHTEWVNAIDFSPDGSRIVSGSSDRTLRLWDVETGQQVGEPLRGHTNGVKAVAFSSNGSLIASGSEDHTVRLWDAETGQTIGEPLRGHTSSINAIAFSRDGSRIVTGSSDRTLRLWNAATGDQMGEPLQGHTAPVQAVSFSPDGSRIVSGSEDNTIRVWDTETYCLLEKPIQGHENRVNSLAFSPDGLQIVSGSEDTTIRLFDLSFESSGMIEPLVRDTIEKQEDTPLRGHIPGFEKCYLTPDGWVKSSNEFLFWVPPENRHGLLYPHSLTIPTSSHLRSTRLDFACFHPGTSWTNIKKRH